MHPVSVNLQHCIIGRLQKVFVSRRHRVAHLGVHLAAVVDHAPLSCPSRFSVRSCMFPRHMSAESWPCRYDRGHSDIKSVPTERYCEDWFSSTAPNVALSFHCFPGFSLTRTRGVNFVVFRGFSLGRESVCEMSTIDVLPCSSAIGDQDIGMTQCLLSSWSLPHRLESPHEYTTESVFHGCYKGIALPLCFGTSLVPHTLQKEIARGISETNAVGKHIHVGAAKSTTALANGVVMQEPPAPELCSKVSDTGEVLLCSWKYRAEDFHVYEVPTRSRIAQCQQHPSNSQLSLTAPPSVGHMLPSNSELSSLCESTITWRRQSRQGVISPPRSSAAALMWWNFSNEICAFRDTLFNEIFLDGRDSREADSLQQLQCIEGWYLTDAKSDACSGDEVDSQGRYSVVGKAEGYVEFSMYKVDLETDRALDYLSQISEIPRRCFLVAGLKDRRSVSIQNVCVPRRYQANLKAAQRQLFFRTSETTGDSSDKHYKADIQSRRTGVFITNDEINAPHSRLLIAGLTIVQSPLRLGDLHMNMFRMALRFVSTTTPIHADNHSGNISKTPSRSTRLLLDRFARVTKLGFPNYFGLQRFGHRDSTYRKGLAVLQNNWLDYISLVLDHTQFNVTHRSIQHSEDTAMTEELSDIGIAHILRWRDLRHSTGSLDGRPATKNGATREYIEGGHCCKLGSESVTSGTSGSIRASDLLTESPLDDDASTIRLQKYNVAFNFETSNSGTEARKVLHTLYRKYSVNSHRQLLNSLASSDRYAEGACPKSLHERVNDVYRDVSRSAITAGNRRFQMHSYCSRIWNFLVSFRLKHFGPYAQPGDLVAVYSQPFSDPLHPSDNSLHHCAGLNLICGPQMSQSDTHSLAGSGRRSTDVRWLTREDLLTVASRQHPNSDSNCSTTYEQQGACSNDRGRDEKGEYHSAKHLFHYELTRVVLPLLGMLPEGMRFSDVLTGTWCQRPSVETYNNNTSMRDDDVVCRRCDTSCHGTECASHGHAPSSEETTGKSVNGDAGGGSVRNGDEARGLSSLLTESGRCIPIELGLYLVKLLTSDGVVLLHRENDDTKTARRRQEDLCQYKQAWEMLAAAESNTKNKLFSFITQPGHMCLGTGSLQILEDKNISQETQDLVAKHPPFIVTAHAVLSPTKARDGRNEIYHSTIAPHTSPVHSRYGVHGAMLCSNNSMHGGPADPRRQELLFKDVAATSLSWNEASQHESMARYRVTVICSLLNQLDAYLCSLFKSFGLSAVFRSIAEIPVCGYSKVLDCHQTRFKLFADLSSPSLWKYTSAARPMPADTDSKTTAGVTGEAREQPLSGEALDATEVERGEILPSVDRACDATLKTHSNAEMDRHISVARRHNSTNRDSDGIKLPGSARTVKAKEEASGDTVVVQFSLPPCSFASVVLRELTLLPSVSQS
eukprot:GHVQ01013083.1.p1 GENE.GHVQ01013083.1~~GHVQ01013083.1.p1  ORF type:complete len:1413 (+),score=155.38 GHVQ01013083.1:3174-7412(+)